MVYQYFSPAPELHDYVYRYHLLEIENSDIDIYGTSWAKQHLMFNYGDAFTVTCPDGFSMNSEQSFFNGSLTRPIAFSSKNIKLKFILVEFQPLVVRSIIKENVDQLTDVVTDFFDVFPKQSPWINSALKENLNHQEKIAYVDSFLTSCFNDINMKSPSILNELIYNMRSSSQPMKILKEGNCTGKSERQIRRMFQNFTGVSPYQYSRYSRIETIQKYSLTAKNISWADIAYKFGFADQAHLINEFKILTSFTPECFIKNRPFTIGQIL